MTTTSMLAMGLFGFGPGELIIFFVLGLVIFGSRLPSVGKNLGKSIIEFKRGIKGVQDEIEDASNEPAVAPAGLPSPDLERERKLLERERQLLERERSMGLAGTEPAVAAPNLDDRRVSQTDDVNVIR